MLWNLGQSGGQDLGPVKEDRDEAEGWETSMI